MTDTNAMDLRETLLALNPDDLSPLAALTKLYELKHMAEAEQREEDELYHAAFGDEMDVHLTSPGGIPFMARVSPGVSDETLAALGALADAAAVQPAASAQPVALTAEQAEWLRKVKTANDNGEGYVFSVHSGFDYALIRGLAEWRGGYVPKCGYWLTDAGRAALAAYEAARPADASTGERWTPKVGERVRVVTDKYDTEPDEAVMGLEGVITGTGWKIHVHLDHSEFDSWFDAAELAPITTPAPAVERAVAADAVAREPEPLAEFEAWVRSTDVAESTFVEIVLDVDDPCLQTMLDLERSAKRVRVRVYAIADDAGAAGNESEDAR